MKNEMGRAEKHGDVRVQGVFQIALHSNSSTSRLSRIYEPSLTLIDSCTAAFKIASTKENTLRQLLTPSNRTASGV